MVVMALKIVGARAARQPHVIYHIPLALLGSRVRNPSQAPVAQGEEDGQERFAFVGQVVGVASAIRVDGRLTDHSGLHQALQTIAEDVCGHVLRTGGEIFEAVPAEREITDDQQRPLIPEQI